MMQPLKYEFAPLDQDSAGAIDGACGGAARPRTFDEAEVEAIRAAALADGEARGRRAAEAQIEAARARALDELAGALGRLEGELAATVARVEQAAAALAVEVGRLIAGQALGEAPLDVVRPMLAETLGGLADGARVTVVVDAALVEAVEAEIASIGARTGFAGRVRVEPGAGAPADCRIDWGDGGIERSVKDIEAEIASRLARIAVTAPEAEPGGPVES